MRIDVISIFPDYLTPLDLSLPGKARQKGLLDLHVHDLRDWAHDRHRTVDDTPYGGGAGMVMKPEPWGEALAAVAGGGRPVLVVPTPAGRTFRQATAAELAREHHLVFACGRYEGIDQRVLDEAAVTLRVRELSLGDYVLNGGEVAALAMIEAVVRLLPGFMGNEQSLVEESHGESGLLEYPVFTKPASWRGHEVPEVLLSGDHGRIAAWRHEQSLRRTASRRPDLLAPAADLDGLVIAPGRPADAGELLVLQRASFVDVLLENPGVEIDELTEPLAGVRAWFDEGTVLVARSAGRLVGAAWGKLREGRWRIARLMVAPDLAGRGIGRELLRRVEQVAPVQATGFEVMTGTGSRRNLRLYQAAGYRTRGEKAPGVVRLTKPISPRD
jgi:tRNA (guanine37-N1)-methyltransferase